MLLKLFSCNVLYVCSSGNVDRFVKKLFILMLAVASTVTHTPSESVVSTSDAITTVLVTTSTAMTPVTSTPTVSVSNTMASVISTTTASISSTVETSSMFTM